ncbi:hypothetical protein FI667_g15368, partial [Globisporangium splendens]
MSKREYFLQKGLHLQQQLSETSTATKTTSSSGSSKSAREVAKYRELCPPATEDSQIIRLLEQHKGDAQRIENAISELWEDYRGGGQDDWATVEKKGKKQQPSSRGHYSSQKSYNNDSQGDESGPAERFSGRGGRGAGRGRGSSFSGRGGRGGGRGRGSRGGVSRSDNREQSSENPAEAGDNENSEGTEGNPALESAPESETTSKKTGSKSSKPAPTPAPTNVAPPPVGPILTGAWTKKPNLAGVIAKPKPIEPSPKPVEKPAPAPKSPSPTKKVEQKSPQKTRPSEPVVSETVVSEPVASEPVVSEPVEKAVSPKKTEPKIESPSISSGWGSLDVSTSGIGEWASTTTENKTVTTPNAWARGSPLLTPVAVAATETPSSLPTVVPGSPKDIQVPRSEPRSDVASASSPKQYLKMGKWDSAATTNLSLQFGSFSFNGVDHAESTSPHGWSSTTTTTTSTTNGGKTVSKTETTQSAWRSTQVSSPKEKTLSPVRKLESEGSSSTRKSAGGMTSAPPGLSVDSGRLTPKSSQSPRTFAPSAPSPASLPKPDEVKRSTPTRGQGHFQSQAGSQTQTASKIGSGSGFAGEFGSKSSGLYQASYNQYSMDLGARGNNNASAGNIAQSQLAPTSSTPKNAGGRNANSGANAGAAAVNAAQSPSHGAQQGAQIQQLQFQQTQQQQQQGQQQQKQHGQQAQQQSQQGHGQHQQQGIPQHHQQGPQGYHPHYAPPPPPGMALPYNPYNYASYYQGYGYYQNPQYAQYSPRTQYPPRGSVPYGVEGPIPGFSNPPNIPVGYQDQHLLAHQHEYAGAIPQGFGEISGAYLQQPPIQQHQGHHHHGHQQAAPQSHGKGSAPISSSQQSHSQRSSSGIQGYQNSGAPNSRDHTSSPPVPNVSAGMSAASYGGQHYGWASYGAQPIGGWGHMMPQGYQQSPSQHQQHPGSHQQSYRQYGNSSAQSGSGNNDTSSSNAGHAHTWSS